MKSIAFIFLFILGTRSAAADEVEKIMGYLPTKSGVTFQVTSGGCTLREDFAFKVKRPDDTAPAQVTMIRVRPDLCHPFIATGERFKFSYQELGIQEDDRFVITNKNGVAQGWIWED